MTLACVWRDNSFGIDRLTALADMRISRKENGGRATISDLARKLIPLSIRCHDLDRLQPVTGALDSPYDTVEAALAYAGSVVEAQAIIAHVQQDLSNLIATNRRVEIDPTYLGMWIEQLVTRYFENHAYKRRAGITLIVFGWKDRTPWFQQIRWHEGAASRLEGTFDHETFLVAGEDSKFVKHEVSKFRTAIARHKRKLRVEGDGDDARFAHELEASRHDVAGIKATEQSILNKIFNDANASIGGTLQKLELAPGQRAACTRLSGDYKLAKDQSLSGDGILLPIDLTQGMGR